MENGHVEALLAGGDTRGAAAAVIRINGPRVRRYLRARLGDPDDADDAFSAFAVWTWRGIASFRAEGSLEAWAFGIARNAARRVRQARRRDRLREVGAAALALARAEYPRHGVELASLRLDAVRAKLPEDARALLGLRLDRRMRWLEIAAVLAAQGSPVSASALRKRFERLKGRMGQLARELPPVG